MGPSLIIGTHIRTSTISFDYAHYMIIADNTDDGFTVLHCNIAKLTSEKPVGVGGTTHFEVANRVEPTVETEGLVLL